MKTLSSKTGGHMVDFLFTLALFCVFAASSLMVVIIGANVYRGTVEHMEQNYETGTSLAYVTTKIRQNDESGAVYLARLDGADALVLEQQVDAVVYQTWIYYYEGALYELFTQVGNADALTPAQGQEILEVSGFTFEIPQEGLLRLTATASDGQGVQRYISLRT